MEIIYFTIAAIILYLVSDWILNRIEKMMGKRSEYRSIIFFAIIMVLAFISFNLVQYTQTGTSKDITDQTTIENKAEPATDQ